MVLNQKIMSLSKINTSFFMDFLMTPLKAYAKEGINFVKFRQI